MAKFDNAKVGDKLWDILLQEWGTVEYVDSEEIKVVYIVGNDEISMTYNLDGIHGCTKTPVLYYREKFIDTSDEIPFNLVEFLRENTRCVDFDYAWNNYYIYYDEGDEEFYMDYLTCLDYVGLIYLDNRDSDLNYVVKTLNEHKVTSKELKDAYKLLGWV
jgi:hypothetical protein